MSEEKTITIRKDALWKYSTLLLLAVLVIGAIFFFTGNDGGLRENTGENNAPTLPTQPSRVEVSADDDPVLGEENAPVEIIEFSDYQCPFCRKFWTETFPLLKSEYIDTGKVRFVYRDFPLDSIHSAATPAAEAANCVMEQGGDEAYFKMHDKIFQEGNILDGGDANTGPVRSTVSFTNEDLKKWANDVGYDIDTCLDSGKFRSEVQKDLNDGSSYGVQGTPGFFINGKPLSGAQPYSVFKQIIDAELA
ncbi:disulfide bond formation protein DsbA [Candidatus Pacearchaeota archaeon CG10_big_fil_rev_8_21_14_0_10_34_76]|nr:MAG: disulfide bond formation protein DsbA [Candidatus Pacearchaeota archaeon CG10_big_fil_rev_8_21_14_0_10_34_76]